MEHLISKDALLAEMDKRKIGYNTDGKHSVEYNTVKKILDILNTLEVREVDEKFDLPKKYETCDWMFIYNYVGLSDEHIKRLNNAINILKSVDEHTDARYLKEIKDKLLELNEMKEVDLEKEFESFLDNIEGVPRMWHSDEQIEWAKDIAKHFFELGLKAHKGEEI